MSSFDSLTWAFEDWFGTKLCDLPDALRQRVEKEFSPMPWDSLDADRRRSVALQLDYQHDPATKQDQQFWWDFYERKDVLKKQIEQWDAATASTAGDLAQKEHRLEELRQELARMKHWQRQARGDYYPVSNIQTPPVRFIAYPKAMKLLAERLDAAPEELAAWIWMGPNDGGLAAYVNANELDPPPRFHYYFDGSGNFDYLSPLMACWFCEEDIDQFEPTDRYITGKVLIERWSKQPGIQPEAFIRAKIAESRLLDIHPICGGTQGAFPQDATYPPLSSGLFALSHIEEIETEDFAEFEKQGESSGSLCQPVSVAEIADHFRVVKDADKNYEWWKGVMREAKRNGLLECRAGEGRRGRGGSLWRPHLIAAWLLDRHAKNRKGMAPCAARSALKKFPGCEKVAEDLFSAAE